MEWITLKKCDNTTYIYQNSSSVGMTILGIFLYVDVWCNNSQFFKDWTLADKKNPSSKFTNYIGANATELEEGDDGYIYLRDATEPFSLENELQYLKISRQQFIQLLDEWQNKVCKRKPKEVIIKHENGQFFIETNN